MSILFSESLKISIGWTLLHTLWQGALLLLVAKMLHQIIGQEKSSLRYFINCAALAVMLVGAAGTFIYLDRQPAPAADGTMVFRTAGTSVITDFARADRQPLWPAMVQWLNGQMAWLTLAWAAGVIFFSLRFFGGLAYLHYLKSKIIVVGDRWKDYLQALSERVGLSQSIILAESIHINKPVVIGYIKPVILLPVGLLSGLPTDQVEAILLHELTHIRRNDYLINLIQSLVEVILFFNPFVWIISGMVRKEREHYCDDRVIALGSSRTTYINALANLEEASLSPTPTLALALNKNRFHVFNRIKRIMETSVNHHPKKIRPAALIILMAVGLACASWLSIHPGSDAEAQNPLPKSGVVAIGGDTTVKKHKDKNKTRETGKSEEKDKSKPKDKEEKSHEEMSGSYSRRTITTYDEDGTPHEEVIEEYNGDEELRPLFSNPGGFSFNLPSIPNIPSLPSIPSIPSIPFMGFSYSFDDDDTVKNFHFSPEDEARWEEFGREMEKRFEDFGRENEHFGEMMDEWADRLGEDFSFHFDKDFHLKMESMHDKFRDLHDDEWLHGKLDHSLRDMEERLKHLDEKLKNHDEEFGRIADNMKEYEIELADQLVKDGYLKKEEKVNAMSWGDGKLSVNGIAIKEKDIPKYEALSKKYFKGNRGYFFRN